LSKLPDSDDNRDVLQPNMAM